MKDEEVAAGRTERCKGVGRGALGRPERDGVASGITQIAPIVEHKLLAAHVYSRRLLALCSVGWSLHPSLSVSLAHHRFLSHQLETYSRRGVRRGCCRCGYRARGLVCARHNTVERSRTTRKSDAARSTYIHRCVQERTGANEKEAAAGSPTGTAEAGRARRTGEIFGYVKSLRKYSTSIIDSHGNASAA